MEESFTFLLNLPNKALMNVIRNMEHPYQLGFSILSKRAMNIVKSLNIEAESFEIQLKNNIELIVYFANIYKLQLNFQELSRELILHGNVNVQYTCLYRQELYKGTNGWNKPEYELSDWINHILNVFNCPKVNTLSFLQGCNRFDIQSIYNVFKEFPRIHIGISFSSEYFDSIFRTFNSIKQIHLSDISFNDRLHDIFIRNFDVFLLTPCQYFRLPKVRLNNLLTLNSIVIELHESRLSEKELNGFIKHWINGSNPRMEVLTVQYPNRVIEEEPDEDDEDAAFDVFENLGFLNFLGGGGVQNRRVLDENIILNGIDYHIIPQEHRRTFKSSMNNWRNHGTIIKGGYDIQRKDGTTATIVITNFAYDNAIIQMSFCEMEMFVWN